MNLADAGFFAAVLYSKSRFITLVRKSDLICRGSHLTAPSAICEDMILRFAWAIKLIALRMTAIHREETNTILACAEIFRRIVWPCGLIYSVYNSYLEYKSCINKIPDFSYMITAVKELYPDRERARRTHPRALP